MFWVVPMLPPAPQKMPMTPITIKVQPILFWDVNASPKIVAASKATISGVTPGNSAPAWAAGANSKPAFASKTIGAPQPATTAANPVHPRRSSARPLWIA
jgi:hypothetical protein